MSVKLSFTRRLVNTLAAVRTGIILLIIVGIVAAAGTVIPQQPLSDEARRAFSPQALAWLERFGLTDVYRTWWFIGLLGLTALSMVLASLKRFPNVWRYFARPYRRPDSHFRAVLPTQTHFPIGSPTEGLEAAERALWKLGLKPQRVVEHDEVSLYAETSRASTLAAYVIHAALLIVLISFLIGKMTGYHGFLALTAGQSSNLIEMQGGGMRKLPFAIRCDGAGQENYPDGTPKRWWSKLTVLENGRELQRKEIVVNDPLVYRGVRFYQASYGATDQLDTAVFVLSPSDNPQNVRQITLGLNQSADLDANTRIRLLRFIPDYYRQDNGEIFQRSRELDNPALQLQVIHAGGNTAEFWMFPAEQQVAKAGDTPYAIGLADLHMGYYTGLQVSHEPAQWGIWIGVVVLGVGLILAFYFVHMRFWALPVRDDRGGLALWVGAASNKNRDRLEDRFQRLTAELETELRQLKTRAMGA